ncbi:MAG: cation diffusion facilitator family transporter [Treponema sp.]|nr:cation diffusion facilitator family transporter [Treponema sp.]
MISLLARIFIKNPKDYSNEQVRTQYGILTGGFGIFLNILLFAGKLVFGLLSASVAMVADAFNNLSDAASSLVQMLGFRLAAKAPDSDHPYGHGRLEYIAGLIISFLILLVGAELFKSSVNALIHPEPVIWNIWSIIIMGLAILVKFYMFFYNNSIGKKINSVAMRATAKDSFNDVISTSVVIISIILSRFTTLPVDGIGGIIVACFILYTGYDSAKETIHPLLGNPPEPEFVKRIEEEMLAHPPIVGVHDLIVHDYGPGRVMISVHAEVPGDQNVYELHDAIDVAEFDVGQKLNCKVVIHMDPIDLKNERLAELKTVIGEELQKIDSALKFHDVRMVPGTTHTNLIFDIVRPYECKLSEEELVKTVRDNIFQRCPGVICVITVDNSYV